MITGSILPVVYVITGSIPAVCVITGPILGIGYDNWVNTCCSIGSDWISDQISKSINTDCRNTAANTHWPTIISRLHKM